MEKICTACGAINKTRILTSTDPETLTLVEHQVCSECLKSSLVPRYREFDKVSLGPKAVPAKKAKQKKKQKKKPKKKTKPKPKLTKENAKWIDMLSMTEDTFHSAADASSCYAHSTADYFSAEDYRSYILAWGTIILDELYASSGLEYSGISLAKALRVGSLKSFEDGMRTRGIKSWDI